MINKFILNFFQHSGEPEIQRNLLRAMSKIMNFTLEEQQSVGVVELGS